MPAKEEYFTLGDIWSNTRLFIRFILAKWLVLLIAILLGGAIGFGLFLVQRPKYVAECTFILDEKQGGLGGLSGLANQFGFDIGGMGGGGMFSGDNILEILRSKTILQRVLLSKEDSLKNTGTLADDFLNFSGLKERWTSRPELASITFRNTEKISELSVLQDSVLNIVFELVLERHLSAERTSKKGTIISTKVVSSDPEFSRLFVERLVAGAKDFYVTAKTSVITSNIARLQKKADSLSFLLTAKSYQVAQSQINDPNPALKMLQVPTEVASRDKTVLLTLYSEVVKNLELAKTSLMLQTPALEILDMPSISLYDNKKGKLFFVALGMFTASMLASVIFLLQFLNRKKNS